MRMRGVLERVLAWLPEWEEEIATATFAAWRASERSRAAPAGALADGARVDLFLDLRVPPDVEMALARRNALEFARTLDGVEAEVYVTAPAP